MSVVGYIDADNEDERINSDRIQEELRKKKLEKGSYDTSDFYLVRAANYLPDDFVIKPICDIPFVVNCNDLAHEAMYRILAEQYNIDVFTSTDEELERFKKEVNDKSPLSTQYRSTIHFTLNSRVSSHDKGNFEDSDYIILDPLIEHLDKENMASFRMEDTFFEGSFKISNSSVVMIRKERYEDLLKKSPYIENYNVVLYSGDDKLALEIMLSKLGIVCEHLASNHAFESPTMPLVRDYIDKEIMENRGVEPVPHFLSQNYKEDDNKNVELWDIYRNNFYNYLLSFTSKSDEEKQEKITKWSRFNISTGDSIIDDYVSVINEIGMDKYCQIVSAYNTGILNAISAGIYPTNTEILSSGKIELHSAETKQL